MPRAGALRLVPVAALCWAAAGAATLAPGVAPWIALALWAIVALAAVAVLTLSVRAGSRPRSARGPGLLRMPHNALRRALVVTVLAAAASAAAASHVAWTQPERASIADLALDGGRAVDVRAQVVGKVERRADGTLAFDARASQFATGTETHAADVEITVRVAIDDVDRLGQLDVGAAVDARGTAAPGRPAERSV
ncbi:competence protein ComEC, partial [Microbacterium sp. ZW CA_36]